jgi:hypothetical protein
LHLKIYPIYYKKVVFRFEIEHEAKMWRVGKKNGPINVDV